MPYIAQEIIAHYQYTCDQGKEVVGCPQPLLQQFIKDGLIKKIGDDPPPESLLGDSDVLSPFKQKDLIQVIKDNNLRGLVKPMTNWTDEQIRQAIRDNFPDVNQLVLPGMKPLINETDTGTTV